MTKRILVVGGCPRSGTTALVRLLNTHPHVLIGDERYYWRFDQNRVDERLFERDRFLDLREEDRHWREGRAPFPGGDTGAAFDAARIVGDKFPRLAQVADHLAETLPDAQLLYIVRNPLSVIESYEARRRDEADHWPFGAERGLADWNDGVRAARGAGPRAIVVTYERLFGPDADPARLFEALDLDPALAAPAEVLNRAASLRQREGLRCETTRFLVAQHGDWEAYQDVASRRCLYA